MDEGLSIEDLSRLASVDRRTVRFYVEQGLLSGPMRVGRYAKYPESDGGRLLAIVQLRQQGKSLAEIRTTMLTMSPLELQNLAAQSMARKQAEHVSGQVRGTALDYLLKLKQASGGSWAPRIEDVPNGLSSEPLARAEIGRPDRTDLSAQADPSPLARLLEVLELHVGQTRTHGSSGVWTRYEVTRDIEIHIRGEQSDEEKTSFRRLAAQLRAVLLGGGG